jgi:ACS family hexuronate transporter-like MFS transporter
MMDQATDRRAKAGGGESRGIPHLRWWIGGILFASTVINYIDRQTLSILAPFLKQDFHWTNTDYANIAVAFRIAYSIGQTVCGRQVDRIGTRRGLTISVIWYSLVSLLTSLANGFMSFAGFRFLLGLGESANWPGASKAVSEWFPKRERGLAAAFYDSGSSVGGAVAPFLILPIYLRWGWRVAFVIPGLLGFVWLIAWRKIYFRPQEHPRITAAERQMLLTDIEAESIDSGVAGSTELPRWRDLLKLPQTWGTIVSKGLTDPVWFFVTDWFPIFLVAKGIALKSGLVAVWIPFLAADLGNFFGGWISGVLIKRGWPVGAARKSMVVFGGFGVMLLMPTIFTTKLWLITLLFAIATFAYAAFSTIANVLPTDLFESRSVATVSGMSGTAAGIGTIIAFELIGHFSDAHAAAGVHSFDPIVVVAGVIPFFGMILVLLLVRNTKETDQGLVKRI